MPAAVVGLMAAHLRGQKPAAVVRPKGLLPVLAAHLRWQKPADVVGRQAELAPHLLSL